MFWMPIPVLPILPLPPVPSSPLLVLEAELLISPMTMIDQYGIEQRGRGAEEQRGKVVQVSPEISPLITFQTPS